MIKILKKIRYYLRIFINVRICLNPGVYFFDGCSFLKERAITDSRLLRHLFFIKILPSFLPKQFRVSSIDIVNVSRTAKKIVAKKYYAYNVVKKTKYSYIDKLGYPYPNIVYKTKKLYIQEWVNGTSFYGEEYYLKPRLNALKTVDYVTCCPKYFKHISKILSVDISSFCFAIQHGDYNEPNIILSPTSQGYDLYVIDYDFIGVYPVLYDYLSILFLFGQHMSNISLFLDGYYDDEIKQNTTHNFNLLQDKTLLICSYALTRFFTTSMHVDKDVLLYIIENLLSVISFLDSSNVYVKQTRIFLESKRIKLIKKL